MISVSLKHEVETDIEKNASLTIAVNHYTVRVEHLRKKGGRQRFKRNGVNAKAEAV